MIRRLARSGLPIFWQTLLLLLSSLVVTQAVALFFLLTLDPPRPDFNRLSDIADALAGQIGEKGGRERALIAVASPAPPEPIGEMRSDPLFTARLAERIGVPATSVRLYFEPDQRRGFPFARGGREDRMVSFRRGEPMFFDTVVAGLDTGNGWRVVRTPPRPAISPWQKRTMLWLATSALLLLPFAWAFARRLARPIRRIADAADRVGADPYAPAVPEEGAAELRVTAHAINRMQRRLAEYLEERTAMIGAIAHDLRTPLARIAFRIEAAPEQVREKVQADIEQMREMIAATIGFVRNTTRAKERRPVDLAALLGRIVEQDRETGRDVTIVGAASAVVAGDPVALARLFQNLIDNGVAWGRRVGIELETVPGPDAGQVTVTIADEGPGLPPDLLERVFQPFERGDPSRNRGTGGIGLGLTIARTIAEDHGGTVTLANRAGGGLAARTVLPLAGVT